MLRQDQSYLRDVQYRGELKLNARARLHQRYGRDDWHGWLASQGAWKENGAYLDVGCGTGTFWQAAAGALPAGMNLTLIDLSPGMVDSARATVEATGHYAAIDARVGDASELPFEDAAFDAALALHMLYHLPEPERGVAELRRVVKPGGQALVVLNGENNTRELAELVAPIFGGAAQDPSAMVFGLQDGADVLRRYFGKVELVIYPDNLEVTDPQDLIDYVASMPGRNDAIAQTRLRRAVDDAFARGGGAFRIDKEVGLLRCTP